MGAQTKEYVTEFSQEDSNQKFVLIDAELESPNVTSVVFKDYEAAFLAGIAAASESQTGQLGFIGGTQNNVAQAFETGFIAGAKTINPAIEISVNYLDEINDENINHSITLTSTLKRVGRVVKQLAQETYEGNFEAGLYEYGLMEGAVDLAAGQLYGETYELVDHYRNLIQNGELNLKEELYP